MKSIEVYCSIIPLYIFSFELFGVNRLKGVLNERKNQFRIKYKCFFFTFWYEMLNACELDTDGISSATCIYKKR